MNIMIYYVQGNQVGVKIFSDTNIYLIVNVNC